jgi:AcrR family transcriptional regulator
MVATRKRLVASALALFARNGIFNTTVEQITEAADVGKGTFYEHFPSKTAIIRHLLQEGFAELLDRCRTELQSATTPEEKLKRLLSAQFSFFDEHGDLLILFHEVRGLLKLKTDEAALLQREYKGYVRFLAQQLGRILVPRRHPKSALIQMACSMAGFVTGYLSYGVITGMANLKAVKDMQVPIRILLEGIAMDGRRS